MTKITKYILGCFIGLFCNAALAVMMVPTLSVDTYTLESTIRVSRTEFIYTYRASLTNPDVAVRNAVATLTITAPGVTVLDSALSFGDMPAKSTAISTDTFSLRYDRSYTFRAADLHWSITYDPTPIITPPAAPSLTLGFGIKQLQFVWASMSGATSYRLMENPDGVSGYAQVGADLPADATATTLDIAVFRHNWANALYLIEACNSSGCTASNQINTLNGMLSTIGYVKASNTGRFDNFGTSVAVSSDGRTLAVGASSEDSNSTGINSTPDRLAIDAGAVYVYIHTENGWKQQAYVKASNTGVAFFGKSVALSSDGNMLAVGASGSNPVSGVYVYTRTVGTWSEQAYVNPPSNSIWFDGQVTLSGDGSTLAVGASSNSIFPGVTAAGEVYIFTRNASTWLQQTNVKASNASIFDKFGQSVALSGDGNTLAVGAPNEASTSTGVNSAPNVLGSQNGAAYIYTRNAGVWLQQAYVKASNSGMVDQFGWSVALSGNGSTLAVGAHYENSSSPGVNNTPNALAGSAGAAYVFTRSVTNWSQQAYVKASNPGIGDVFGTAVALSIDGNTLAVGAPGEASSIAGINGTPNELTPYAGAVYVYTRSVETWLQQAYVKASNPGIPLNTGINDMFGVSVALSGDGNTLAVGAPNEASDTTGIGSTPNELAPNAGAVYLY